MRWEACQSVSSVRAVVWDLECAICVGVLGVWMKICVNVWLCVVRMWLCD